MLAAKYASMGVLGAADDGPDFVEEHIEDDQLRLMFVACHPAASLPSRVALTLRVVGGLSTREIARAYVLPEATIAQRIVRAKKAISSAGVAFEVPVGEERVARLASVLEVIYLIFNEGYSATAGNDWTRPELCADAVRLARRLASLAPDEPEVLGLLALLEIQSSRLFARIGADGEPVLLLDQDRRRWDRLHITLGLDALSRAEALQPDLGPYVLQAAIAACHAAAFRADETDWRRVAALYDRLAAQLASPVVELNRAVAISMAHGPAAGLAIVDLLAATGALADYHLLHSVRADLLEKVGRREEAARTFEAAAQLTHNDRERQLLLDRAGAARAATAAPSRTQR